MPNHQFLSRRSFLVSAAAAAAACGAPNVSRTNPNDIRIDQVDFEEEFYLYRAPIKFGGTEVDRVTLLNVRIRISNRAGKSAEGFGSMPLGNVWSFPSRVMKYEETLAAMQGLAKQLAKITGEYKEFGHPVEINHHLEPEWLKVADDVSRQMKLAQPIPKLCTLTTGSPFDAALNDAYGKLYNRSVYHCYTREFLAEDLGRYLGPDYTGLYLDAFVLRDPKPRMPLYHLVGAVDPITARDVTKPLSDGLPQILPDWIEYNGLTHLKIKLNGEDLAWDRDRVLAVERTAAEAMKKRGATEWFYSLDFNEKCPNVDYLLAMLKQVQQKSPQGFARIQYVEQPTKRDLKADRANVMHEAAKLRPVVIDESLVDLESLMLAREMGYSGAALKACKGQAQALLMAAAAQKHNMFLCVQDLTCPGASLIHSAGLAAHVPTVAAIEANARQYVPAANAGWEKTHPGIFVVKDGYMQTGELTGPGLSARPA